jgi:hypothetical protein
LVKSLGLYICRTYKIKFCSMSSSKWVKFQSHKMIHASCKNMEDKCEPSQYSSAEISMKKSSQYCTSEISVNVSTHQTDFSVAQQG